MSIEAMKLALEVLTDKGQLHPDDYKEKKNEAIAALRTAIKSAEKQEPVAHSVVAGALFDFMGWLTSRDKRLMLSSTDEATPAVEAIAEFAKMRGLLLEDAQVEHWQATLTTPPAAQRQPQYNKTEMNCFVQNLYDQKMREGKRGHYETMFHVVHRAIEAAHGIKEKNT